MQNEIITYTQHTGEVVARGAARAVAPERLGESVHEACCPTGTRESAHVVSGRSMIEMLGVLAIIGALSVGGLAALRVAQNKVRANVIANDVMLAAADLLARQDVLTAGSVVNTFSFTPKTTTLTAEKCPEDANIEIMVSSVPQAVCEQVVRNGAVKGTQGIGVAKSGSAFCDGSTLNSSCSAGNNNLVFVLGANTRELCGGEYCKTGYYCSYDTTATSCTDKGAGKCIETGTKPTSTTAGGITFFRSSAPMNWWSAISWCQAQGGHAMPYASLGCGYNVVDPTNNHAGYCNTNDNIASSGTRSLQMNALMTTFLSGNGWLADEEGNDCKGYLTYFSDGLVSNYHIKSKSYSALCQE